MDDPSAVSENGSPDRNVLDVYPLSCYYFGSKGSVSWKNETVADRVLRMKANYDAYGMRKCVAAVIVSSSLNPEHSFELHFDTGLINSSDDDDVVLDMDNYVALKCSPLYLLGRKNKFDRDVLHRGRSNEYELRDKGKRIVLKPMSPQSIRSMSSNRGEKPNLTMFASEREIEHVIDDGERRDGNGSWIRSRFADPDPFFRIWISNF
ncbi:hypothetical protein OROMI_002415 [Orobanche minor]